MASTADMSAKRLGTIDDLVREELNLKATCEHCGHCAVVDAAALRARLHVRRKSRQLSDIEERMKCSRCRSTSIAVWPTDSAATSLDGV